MAVRAWLPILLVAFLAGVGTAAADLGTVERAVDAADQAVADPQAALDDPQGVVGPVVQEPPPEEEEAIPPPEEAAFADRVRDALQDDVLAMGLAGTGLALAGLMGFALVTRYISPKEALRNPQRAMLYGYVRGHPGVHLKQLSEEFAMKTSSILWHIRKLESADLVHSDRANGFRVFYPVEGGIEIKRVSRAITALHNANAKRIYETIERHQDATVRHAAQKTGMHTGTVRWHLRKLREFGLVEERVRDDGSRFHSTDLGRKALRTLDGAPATAPRPVAIPTE